MPQNSALDLDNITDISFQIAEATDRIVPFLVRTALEQCSALSTTSGTQVYLKCEHLQHTGSFKLRGAINKLMRLQKASNGCALEVIAASTGNHGLAVAYAAQKLNAQATIYLPQSTPSTTQAAIQSLGATIVPIKGDGLNAEIAARSRSETTGRPYISPYNDIDVIIGQGTIGYEMHQQMKDIDAVFMSVGGGGFISGVGAYLKAVKPDIKIVGCWPKNAPAMLESLQAGRIVDTLEKPTLSTATAGGVEPNSITFPLCQRLIDDYVTVSEGEIADGIKFIAEHEHWLIEGAAAVAVAAFTKMANHFRAKKVAIVLCGRNLNLEQLEHVLK